MPQLDLSFFKINIISLLISFFGIYLFVKYLLLNSYYKIIAQRNRQINDNIAKAEDILRQGKQIEETLAEVLSIKKQSFLRDKHDLINTLEEINKKNLIKFEDRMKLENLEYIKDFKKQIRQEIQLIKYNLLSLSKEIYSKVKKENYHLEEAVFNKNFLNLLKKYE